jgi:hypothetical protein
MARAPRDLVAYMRWLHARLTRVEDRAVHAGVTQNYVAGGRMYPRTRLPALRIDVIAGETKQLHSWRNVGVTVGTCDVELFINDGGAAVLEGDNGGLGHPIQLVHGDTLDFYIDPSTDAEDLTIALNIRSTP